MWASKVEMLLWMTSVVRTVVSQLIYMQLSMPPVSGFFAARKSQCLQSTNKRVDKQKRPKTVKYEKKRAKFLRQAEKEAVFLYFFFLENGTNSKIQTFHFLDTNTCRCRLPIWDQLDLRIYLPALLSNFFVFGKMVSEAQSTHMTLVVVSLPLSLLRIVFI